MTRIDTNANTQITADKVRVIDPEGENIGVKPFDEALQMARDNELDLVEVAPNAEPPVTKIMDFGKYKYEKQKSRQGSKSDQVETKTVQVKINTGEHDLQTKADQASGWLEDGHRVRLELYLRGRAKGKSREFHRERMDRFLKFITADYEITQEPEKGPKGLNMILQPK